MRGILYVGRTLAGNDLDKSPEEVAKLFKSVLKTIRKSHPETPVFWIAGSYSTFTRTRNQPVKSEAVTS